MFALVAVLLAAAPPPSACGAPDACSAASRPGEVSLVFLGDTGYGPGGASEWGPHAQGQVAAQLTRLCPRPDLVIFLGDNIYWTGSPDLFGPRFDRVYARLFDPDHRRVHAALGNHDVKGCQLSARSAFAADETCAHALYRLVIEDVERDTPPGDPGASSSPLLVPDVLERARRVSRQDCPPAFDLAYEQMPESGTGCYATEALRHEAFGYGVRGGNPLRYYSIDFPPADEPPAGRPRVRVLVADTNTLRSGPGGDPGEGDEVVLQPEAGDDTPPPRTDRLQALWLENQLRTAGEDAWRIVAVHHPAFTPRGCAFRILGRCVGGHGDDPAAANAMFPAWTLAPAEPGGAPSHAPHRPDLVFGAHNHLYARSRPLDVTGYPTTAAGQGIRHVVAGGGGAPLYRIQPLHARYAAGGAFHHFVYVRLRGEEAFYWVIDQRGRVRDSVCFSRGESIDRCIAGGTWDSDTVTCGEPAPSAGCPLSR